MKSWEEMTNREKAEVTHAAIKKRQEIRKRAEAESRAFLIESAYKCNKRHKEAKKRGCRSF